VGQLIASKGMRLVYGGGNVGLMGVVATAALEAGAEVIGIIPHDLMRREVGYLEVTKLHVVDTMHERKAMMSEMSDGFLTLPGGFGTFEEFFEVITWAQLGIHTKPCALLNISGYYDPLIALLEHSVEHGMIKPKHRDLLIIDTDPDNIIEQMENYEAPDVNKWLDPSKV
jgi:uncharacterized protein (TIGR00730 family)